VLDALWDKLELVRPILDYSARQAEAYPTRVPETEALHSVSGEPDSGEPEIR
jgi:hypothetical protein